MSELLYTEDMANKLGKSVEAVRALVRRGSLPAPFRLGRRNVWRLEDVDRWLEEQARASREGTDA